MTIDKLKERIAGGYVAIVAGTGVSMSATAGDRRASWSGLLRDGIARCVELSACDAKWAARKEQSLAEGGVDEWIAVASEIETTLRRRHAFREWLKDTVGALKVVDRSVPEALAALGGPLLTLNYDEVLESVLDRKSASWTTPAIAQQVVQRSRNDVLHLHGYWDDPDSVVLGYQSYQAVLDQRGAQALQQALRATRSLLFVGCEGTFEDPNLQRWLEWARTCFGGDEVFSHYVIVNESKKDLAAQFFRPEDRVQIVPYSGGHERLAPFLRSLAPAGGHTPTASIATTAPRRAGGLPAIATGELKGRAKELEDMVAGVLDAAPRPIAVRGGPGIGKTALTVTALRDPRVAARFGERRWFVECDGVTAVESLHGQIALSVGAPLGADLWRTTRILLGHGPALLVLDNFETPWRADHQQAEALLSELSEISGLALVVSVRGSERPLGVRWREFAEVQSLEHAAAREAFLAIAGSERSLDPALDDVLRTLDGVPLALTLMAAAAQSYPTLERLLGDWRVRRTDVLKRGSHRTLNLDVSISLSLSNPKMSDAACELVSALGILPGGIADVDLDALWPTIGNGAASVLKAVGLAQYRDGRLQMLAPIRESIRGQRVPDDQLRTRVERYYLTLCRRGRELGQGGGGMAVQRLEPEIVNLETIVREACRPEPPDVLAQAAEGLAILMRFRGIGSPETIESVARTFGDLERTRDQGEIIRRLGDIALARSAYQQARKRYEEASSMCRRVGDVAGEASCIQSLGTIALELSEMEQATARYEEALLMCRAIGDLLGEANCIRRLGDVALHLSDDEQAGSRCEEALAMYRAVGNVLGEANCIQDLGTLAMRREEYEEARARFEAALPMYRISGDVLGEANCILRLGDIALAQFDRTQARSKFEIALLLFERISHPYSIASTLRRLARLLPEGAEKAAHVARARAACEAIDREDRVAAIDREFGRPESG